MMEPEGAVRNCFEEAVARRVKAESQNLPSQYLAGVAAALGWVIGEYEEPPIEE